jgi:hypothetical protein
MYRKYAVTFLFSIFVIVSTLIFYILFIDGSIQGSDYSNYLQGANSIINYSVYSTQGDISVPDNFRPIGYSLILVIAKQIDSIFFNEIIVIFQSVLLIFMYIMILKVFEVFSILSKKTILVSAMFFIHPMVISTVTHVQVDLMLSFFILLFVLNLVFFIRKNDEKYLYYGVIFLGISLYFRPTFLYFIPIFFLLLSRYVSIKKITISIIIIMIIIAPWSIRNKLALDSFSFSRLGDVVLTYFAADTLRHKLNLTSAEAHNIVWKKADIDAPYYLNNKNDENKYNRMRDVSIEIIVNNFDYFILSYARGLARVFVMPHEIYSTKENTTIRVDDFIDKLKSNPKLLVSDLNAYFIYLYIFPYLLNIFILFGLIKLIIGFRFYLRGHRFIYYLFTLIVLYGLLIPGPINKPHYMLSYYSVLIIFVVFAYFAKDKGANSGC